MSTRLQLEHIIKTNINEAKRISVLSHARGEFTAYIGDINGELNNTILRKFNTLDFPVHMIARVKPYNDIDEEVSITGRKDLPNDIITAAIFGDLNKKGIELTIQKLFPHINLLMMEFDKDNGILNFLFSKNISEIEKYLLHDYIEELTPIDIKCEINLLELQ